MKSIFNKVLVNKNISTFLLACIPLVCMLFFISSCERHSTLQTEGEPALHGVWVQENPPYESDLRNFTSHEFKFVCDSVYITLKVREDVQKIPDSCYNDGQWEEYAKAVYVTRQDSLIMEGIYCKSDGGLKVAGCYREGQFGPRYRIAHLSEDSLVLSDRSSLVPIVLKKTMHIDCEPKERWEY